MVTIDVTMTENLKKLNLGSSGRKKEGYINVDWLSLVKPDVEHNLNVYPYPFKNNEFDVVEANHVIEHLERPFEVMREICRISKPGSKIIIRVPHFSRGMAHPEHVHGFDVTFPNYFNKKYADVGYFGVDLQVESLRLKWFAFPHITQKMGFGAVTLFFAKLANSIINFFANLSPSFCSRIWCFWVGGFEEIEFVFIK